MTTSVPQSVVSALDSGRAVCIDVIVRIDYAGSAECCFLDGEGAVVFATDSLQIWENRIWLQPSPPGSGLPRVEVQIRILQKLFCLSSERIGVLEAGWG